VPSYHVAERSKDNTSRAGARIPITIQFVSGKWEETDAALQTTQDGTQSLPSLNHFSHVCNYPYDISQLETVKGKFLMRIISKLWNWQPKVFSKHSNSFHDVRAFQANFTYAKTVILSATTTYRIVIFFTVFAASSDWPHGSYPHFLSCVLKIHLNIVLFLPSSFLFSCFPTKISYAGCVYYAFFETCI
jgi:hypothetical protein